MENSSNLLKKTCRLSFLSLRKNGYRIQINPWLIVYWEVNDEKNTRILWNLSRKIGKAVIRNKLKRWCREYIRTNLRDIACNQGLDLNLVFRLTKRGFYKDLRREEIDKELSRVEKKIRERLIRSS